MDMPSENNTNEYYSLLFGRILITYTVILGIWLVLTVVSFNVAFTYLGYLVFRFGSCTTTIRGLLVPKHKYLTFIFMFFIDVIFGAVFLAIGSLYVMGQNWQITPFIRVNIAGSVISGLVLFIYFKWFSLPYLGQRLITIDHESILKEIEEENKEKENL